MILDKPTTSDTTQGGACALEVGADMDEEKLQELVLLWDRTSTSMLSTDYRKYASTRMALSLTEQLLQNGEAM